MYKDQTPLRSISVTTQGHKFFERYLDNDLDVLAKELQTRYELIESAKIPGVTPVTPFDTRQLETWFVKHANIMKSTLMHNSL
jgi:hypothetical protein